MVFDFNNENLFYGQFSALKKLKLSIQAGEKVAIIGESGSGKSTLLNALREQRPHDIAWCPQQLGLVAMLSCLHNIYMGQLQQHHFLLNLKRLIYPGAKIIKEIEAIASQLAIENQLNKACEQLSGGQQQRTAIGRAIYSKQNIFLGDEPVSALDGFQAEHILALLCRTFETLVVTLHDIKLAKEHCQRVIALKDGEIFFDRKSHELSAEDLSQVYR
ncbi:MAG: phosphonate transport system ATP-binding protein [Flavobacteriales bacterium]|jgi:phosphonate transport system ATP-binding protein